MQKRERVFLENPHDVETVFVAMKVAEREEKQMIFMDMFIAHLRMDQLADITNICYMILRQMGLMDIEKTVI